MDENTNKLNESEELAAAPEAPGDSVIPASLAEKPAESRAAVAGFVFGVAVPSVILVPVMWRLLGLGVFVSDFYSAISGDFGWLGFDMLDSAGFILFLSSAVMSLAAVIYSVNIIVKKIPLVNQVWAIVSALYCVWFTFVFIHLMSYYDLFGGEELLAFCALCMTIILVSMTGMVLWITPEGKKRLKGKPTLLLLLVPVLWYIFLNIGMYAFSGELVPIWLLIFVAALYGFIFLSMYVMLAVLLKKGSGHIIPQIVIFFLLPSLGLFVSQTFSDFSFFWDFSSPVYYLLVLINGALLMLPEPSRTPLRALKLFAEGAMYLFTFYFFVCLSPYYALALPGIIYYGIGLLVLSPLFLIVYQTKLVIERLSGFSRSFGRVKTAAVFILGMLVLPACLTFYYIGDRGNIDTAIAVMNGDADAGEVNLSALRSSLNYMNSGRGYYRSPPPMISMIYKYASNSGQILGDSSYARAQALFFAEESSITGRNKRPDSISSGRSSDVDIADIKVETRRDGDDYKSTVHFTVTNTGKWDIDEYATSFKLPDGVFISDYYLDVFGVRKSGLLSVKQAATWIYNRVVASARDPGILYYDGDEIVFKVFPFSSGESRYTGIEFLHREPVTLEIDDYEITLEAGSGYLDSPVELDGAVYFGAEYKERLAASSRKPRYAFVVDCSINSDTDALISRLKQFCENNKIDSADATVTALNYRSAAFPMSGGWEAPVKRFPREGGLGVDIAADGIYKNLSTANTYPVMIVLSDNIDSALLPADASYMSSLCPELDGYYVLSRKDLSLYPFDKYAAIAKVNALPGPKPALEAGDIFLRDDGRPQLVIKETGASSQQIAGLQGKTWENGIRLAAKTGQLRFSDGQSRFADSLNIIKGSFATGIMTPQTSYIVLETPEQEAQLKARQQQILASGDFDYDDTPVTMSEPPILLCAAVAILAVWLVRKRKTASKPR